VREEFASDLMLSRESNVLLSFGDIEAGNFRVLFAHAIIFFEGHEPVFKAKGGDRAAVGSAYQAAHASAHQKCAQYGKPPAVDKPPRLDDNCRHK
jgi:hypothetical protein